ncbi:uncharacterized protein LOC108732810 [Agrilus planipennis]|uniref:Uncharacterized protein LOC108732810 n=1 Tax=Agrilus planipennis TaxID=224129 RepID=A0A1W4WFN8_AGRPL|nr:uncharacterized protein LOC108732810 [Agrilus planipennis]
MEVLNQSCRTCLRKLDDKFYGLDHIEQFEDITLTAKLLACVPEMNLDSWSASLCFSCTATLRLAYEFRKMCLATEVRIQNEYQYQVSDNKISVFEQPIVKTEPLSLNESKSVEVKVEETYLDEDEDDWLRANGYFNTNSDDKDTDIDDTFEETDTAESDAYECISHNPQLQNSTDERNNTSDHTNFESDTESIIRKSCENIKFLKERNIIPENLQCHVTIEKLPESYSNAAIEDTLATNSENDEPNDFYSCDQCAGKFSISSYWEHLKYECVHTCEICNKQHNGQFQHLQHMKEHKETERKCSYCDRVFFTKMSYAKHQVYHKNRLCLDCNLHFTTRKELYDHKEEHKKQDSVNKKKLGNQATHVHVSTPSTSEEQFRRIIVSEDVFEKAVKSFSTDFFDEKPPIIEKYCCSGNCNCANKNFKYGESSESSEELPGILPFKNNDNDLLFVSDSVRKCKEIAKKNIKRIMSRAEYRKRILKQGFYGNGIASEHNYCKQYFLPKKERQKKKHIKKSNAIPKNSNVVKDSFNLYNVSNIKQTQDDILQQVKNSETTNTVQNSNVVIGNKINEQVVPPNECNDENAKKSFVEDVHRKCTKVNLCRPTDGNVAQEQIDLPSEANMNRSKENNETSYAKIRIQKASTESSGINNMSLADLLKDTVNVNSKVRQGVNSEIVTLKDLLNDLDDPPTSVHVVTPFNGTVTNYIFPNSTDLTKQLTILLENGCVPTQKLPTKKTRPKILKEVLNKTVGNISTQSQISTNNVEPVVDNTRQLAKLRAVPVHDDKLQSNQKPLVPIGYINDLQTTAFNTSEIFDKKPIFWKSDVACSEIDKSLLKTNSHNEIPNNEEQIESSTNESKSVKIVISSSSQHVVSNMIMTTPLIADSFALHIPTGSTNNFVSTLAPILANNHSTDSQKGCLESPSSSELNSTLCPNGNLFQTASVTFPLIELNTSNNLKNPEKCFSNGNPDDTAYGRPHNETNSERNIAQRTTTSTKGSLGNDFDEIISSNRLYRKENDVGSSSHIGNITVIQPTTSGTNSNEFQFHATKDNINKIRSSYLSTKTNVNGISSTKNYPKQDCSLKSIVNTNYTPTLTNIGPKNYKKQLTPFSTTLQHIDNKECSSNPRESTVSVSNDSVLTNTAPANQQKKSTHFPTALNYVDHKTSSINGSKTTVSVNNDLILTKSGSTKKIKEQTTFPTTLKYDYSKETSSNPGKSTVRVSNESTLTYTSPAKEQRELTPIPTIFNYANNKKNSGNTSKSTITNKPTVSVNNDPTLTNASAVNQKKESASFPTTLKYSDNKRYSSNTNKLTISASNGSVITKEEPANPQKESTPSPSILKCFNKSSRSNIDKPTVYVNDDSKMANDEPGNQQRKSTPLPTTLKFIDKKSNDNNNKPTVNVDNDSALTSKGSANQQTKSSSFLTSLKHAINKRICSDTNQPTVGISNNSELTIPASANQQGESIPAIDDDVTYVLQSDTDDTVIDCDRRNNDVDNVVDLTADSDTFSVNFNYIRGQMEDTSRCASENEIRVSHSIRVKSFAKEKHGAATVTTQSSAERSYEQENHFGNFSSSQTIPKALKPVVSVISPQNEVAYVPETFTNECIDSLSCSTNSENRSTTNVDNIQKRSASEENVGHPTDVISLAKRDYDREIKKMFNLTFKPLSSSTTIQKCDVQDKETEKNETKSDETNKDEQSHVSKINTSSNDCKMGSRENHHTDQSRDNETQLHSNLNNNSIHEKNESLNYIESSMVFDSEQRCSTFDESTRASKHKVYVLNRNPLDFSEQADKLNSDLVKPLVSKSSRRKTFDKREILKNENTITTEYSDFDTMSSSTKVELFDSENVMETSNDECTSEASSKNDVESGSYTAKQKENKSSNPNVKKYAISENSFTSNQPVVDERLCEQASSKDLNELSASNESNNATQLRSSKNKCLSNVDFESFHRQLNTDESKKMRLSTNVNSKLKIRSKKLNNKSTSKDNSESKLGHVQEKCPFKKIETRKSKGSANAIIAQKKTDSNEPEIVTENFTERKGKFVCKVCRKYFDYTFQRELHECQISFAPSPKKAVKDTTCEKCGNVFTNEILKNMHVCHISRPSSRNGWKESVKWTCTVCNKRFSSYRLLNIHLNDAHEKLDGGLTMSTSSKAIQQCFFCKKYFKNGIYRFLHLLRHFSFRKHNCRKSKGVSQKQTDHKRQSGNVRKYRLSELADVLQIGNIKLMKICKHMQKEAFSNVLNKILNYLHLVRCRKCNRISGGWFNETLQSYFIKWRYLHNKPLNSKATNNRRNSVIKVSPKSDGNCRLPRIVTNRKIIERNKTTNFLKQTNTIKSGPSVNRIISKQTLIREQMLRVMSDLGLSAKEMNTFTSDALKNTSCQKAGFSRSTEDENELYNNSPSSDDMNKRLYQLFREKDESPKRVTLKNEENINKIEQNVQVTPNYSHPKQPMCKYCLLKFKSKLTLKMHKDTPLHKQNVSLLQKSENEIEQEVLKAIDQPQTVEDIKRAIKYTMNKIKMIKKYHCEVCSDSFISRNQLEMHRKKHKKHEFQI